MYLYSRIPQHQVTVLWVICSSDLSDSFNIKVAGVEQKTIAKHSQKWLTPQRLHAKLSQFAKSVKFVVMDESVVNLVQTMLQTMSQDNGNK